MAREIDVRTVRGWQEKGEDFVLLDVLPRDAYEELRLPGAKHACVYEVTFLDQVEKAGVAPGAKVVTYCSGPASRASADAADRLAAAGFRDVHRFTGGRRAWVDAGLPVEGTAKGRGWMPDTPRRPAPGTYAVDPASSTVRWVGRNIGGRHDGTVGVSGGTLRIGEGGRLAAGAFEIDLRTIAVGDLQGEMARMLVAHLESADFFEVNAHPRARIEMTGAKPIADAPDGMPNHAVKAKLTLRGVTKDVSFEATVAGKEGVATLEAHFDVDRTRWGATYGSAKLYHRLGMHLVDDLVTVEARIRALPA